MIYAGKSYQYPNGSIDKVTAVDHVNKTVSVTVTKSSDEFGTAKVGFTYEFDLSDYEDMLKDGELTDLGFIG